MNQLAYRLAITYGFYPFDDCKFEAYTIADETPDIFVLNIANRPRNFNCAFKVDTTHLDQYDMLESDSS